MGKQLSFTKKEQNTLQNAITAINCILLKKMDKGVETPTLQGEMSVNGEDCFVEFYFKASRKQLTAPKPLS
jgi:hypothetical protein